MIPRAEAKQEQAVRYIRTVLWVAWDPIGIFGIPECEDEYDRYATVVYSLLRRSASAEEITDYLYDIQTRHMGVPVSDKYHVPLRLVVSKLRMLLSCDCFNPLD